jgi:hypothetical protein
LSHVPSPFAFAYFSVRSHVFTLAGLRP